MKKCMNRGLALLIAATMTVSSIPAYAAEVTETQTTTEGDLTTDTTTTTTTETDENGNVTVVVKIDKTTEGTDEDGLNVERNESYDETEYTSADGLEGSLNWVESGSEHKEGTMIDSGNEAGQQKIEVQIKPGGTATGSATSNEVTGDVKDGDDDQEYDYTISDTVEREASASASEIEIKVNQSSTELKGPIADREGKGNKKDLYNDDGHFEDPDTIVVENAPEGYEYMYSGTGDYSHRYVGVIKVYYEKDPLTGETLVDENGNYVVKEITSSGGKKLTVNGEKSTDINATFDQTTGSRAMLHFLKSETGEIAYAYCVDFGTKTKDGAWYTVANLEDNDYYASEDSENHIRGIAMNGYWGTKSEMDENGNYAFGSLESIKQKMKEAIRNGEIENTVVEGMTTEDGKPVYLLDIMDGLTEGEALDMTQAAIWTYSNGGIATKQGQDGKLVAINSNPQILFDSINTKVPDPECAVRLNAMYNWLLGLTAEESKTEVINENNSIQDIAIVIGDKTTDREENKDDNHDNDIYDVDMNFTLAFVPGDNDDLLVRITYKDLDGNDVSVVKRLAGKNGEGQSYETITPDADGNYTLKGLKLSENKDFDFDLKLEGTQYLDKGVYIYTAHGGIGESQTLVGVAEGSREVEVTANMKISFNVDENDKVKMHREWKVSGSDSYKETEETETETGEENDVKETETETEEVPGNENWTPNDPGDGTTEIEDEDVPMADAPATGDIAVMLLAAAAVSGAGFVAVASKKKED